ncbi:unnamed protein product [Vitrella brassicaformis CCMP3155]|uniref:Trichohyalin-plectin-homology domain-containing protein n=1 Tax=Vitrella brassicaformis (strain CCMP3155) TaxID=1169540 RepID=A0A0G4FDP2_VITBC|nr:unnamed protein product [Vitrella brassicaformis CCMP3155]|eukprot:CEM10999.1 unnamed protein product [Vitrella brassicaformis CCMP3155]
MRARSSLAEDSKDDGTEDRLALHKKSQERASRWSNTLQGARRLKIEMRKKRLADEEAAKQAVDNEEAAYQKELKKKAIGRALELSRQHGEHFRAFQGNAMLTDIHTDWEEERTLKEELGALEKQREAFHLEQEQQAYRRALEREVAESLEREKKVSETQKERAEQLEEMKRRRLQEIQDEILQGEMLKKKAEEDIIAERTAEVKRREMAQKTLEETVKSNKYFEELKQRERQVEAEQDAAISGWAKRKEEMQEKMQKRSEEIFNAKLATRQRMIDEQARLLQAIHEADETRAEREAAEFKAKEDAKFMAKEEQARLQRQMIEEHRAQQLAMKKANEEARRAEDQRMLQHWHSSFSAMCERDDEDRRRRFKELQDLAAFNRQLAELKAWEVQKAKDDERASMQKRLDRIAHEDADFARTAIETITDMKKSNRSPLPLIKQLKAHLATTMHGEMHDEAKQIDA